MPVIRLAARLAALEARLARYRPPAPAPAWLGATTRGELEWLEQLTGAVEGRTRQPTPADMLRAIEIEAAATRRMLESEAA